MLRNRSSPILKQYFFLPPDGSVMENLSDLPMSYKRMTLHEKQKAVQDKSTILTNVYM